MGVLSTTTLVDNWMMIRHQSESVTEPLMELCNPPVQSPTGLTASGISSCPANPAYAIDVTRTHG